MKSILSLLLVFVLLLPGGHSAMALTLQDNDPPAPTAAPDPVENAAKLVADANVILEAGTTPDDLDEALFYYKAALVMDNRNADALLGIADVYIRLGDFDTALATLKEYGGADPDEAVLAKIAELESGNVNDSSGKVRKISGYSSEGVAYVHLYAYDDQGRLSRITWFDGDGVEQDHADVTYDEQGRKLTDASTILSGSTAGQLIHTQRTYNEEGRLIATKSIYPDRESETRYIFDDQGRNLQWETYVNGSLQMIERFEDYNDHGDYQKKSLYFVNGKQEQLVEYSLIEYDYSACTVKTVQYDRSKAKKGWTESTYSADWRTLLHQVSYAADGSIQYEYHTEVD